MARAFPNSKPHRQKFDFSIVHRAIRPKPAGRTSVPLAASKRERMLAPPKVAYWRRTIPRPGNGRQSGLPQNGGRGASRQGPEQSRESDFSLKRHKSRPSSQRQRPVTTYRTAGPRRGRSMGGEGPFPDQNSRTANSILDFVPNSGQFKAGTRTGENCVGHVVGGRAA